MMKKRRAGRPPLGNKRMNRVNVNLAEEDMKKAKRLGGGSISAGLRIALELAAKAKKEGKKL